METRLFILDCDGVMVDSREANIDYYNRLMKKLGRPNLTAQQEELAHMLSNEEALAAILPAEEALCENILTNFTEADYQRYNNLLKPEPGLAEFLAWLSSNRINSAICTNRTTAALNIVLDIMGLQGDFDFIATADMVKKPKPDPEMLNMALNHFNFEPRHCLYVGDTKADVQAALKAELPFLAFKSPLLPALGHISSFAELKSWVSK